MSFLSKGIFMKKKWQIFLSIILYIIILTYAIDFDILRLIDLQLVFLTLVGTLILTVPFYEKGIGYQEFLYIFGRKSIDTGFIQTFLLFFARLQDDVGYERLLSDIALCFRPLLYGFCLFILLTEKPERKTAGMTSGQNKADAEPPDNENSGKEEPKTCHLPDFAKAYRLTRRETEIAQLILQGKTNAEIAGELFISETTVKKHVSNIFEKTGISRREELFIKIRDE